VREPSRLPLLIPVITAILLMAVVFWHVDFSALGQTILSTKPIILFAAFMVFTLQSLLLSLRWHLFIRLDRPHATLSSSAHTTILAQAANTIMLAGVSGLLIRVGLAIRQGMTLHRAFCASVMDRLSTAGILALMAMLSLPLYFDQLQTMLNVHVGLAQISIIILIIAIGLIAATSACVMIPRLVRRDLVLLSMFNYSRRIMRLPVLTSLILISLLAQCCYFGAVLLLIRGLGVDLDPVKFMMLIPWITLVSSLPISIGGWGLREMSFSVGLGLLGVPIEQALTASIQTGLIGLASILVLALPMLMDRRTIKLLHDLSDQTQDMISRYRRRQQP
jgi:glycosyltransferase 2 family protein